MRLSDIEVYIGVVVDKDDPQHLGRVRVNIPGLFECGIDPDTGEQMMEIDDLFWVNPLTTGDYQGYGQLLNGNKVWVLHNVNNYYEYWYVPYFELNNNTKTLIDNKDLDIIVSRAGNEGDAMFYYSKEKGFNLNIAGSKMQVDSGGSMNAKLANVDMKADSISLNGGTEQAVLGNKLQALLTQLASDIAELSATATATYTTTPIGPGLQKIATHLKSNINNIVSNDIRLS